MVAAADAAVDSARSFVGCRTRRDAVLAFREILDRHAARVDASKKKIESIYRFETPKSPYVEFVVSDAVTSVFPGYAPADARWARTPFERRLASAMVGIAARLELAPYFDYVPSIHPGHGTSDLIGLLYGLDFDHTPEGAVINKKYAILDLARDAHRLPEPDALSHPVVRDQVDFASFAAEALDGAVQIVYPQLQGPLANIMRLMPQEDMLMACADAADLLADLAERTWKPAVDIMVAMNKAVGSPGLLRPRGRFYQPDHVKGLIVDDYISVIAPETYFQICARAFGATRAALGPIYFHTCGPALQAVDAIRRLPGVAAFETAFVDGQHSRAADVVRLKAAATAGPGPVVCSTFGLPHGDPVEDMENLDAAWLQNLSDGGGYLMGASGTAEAAMRLARLLGLQEA